MITAALPRWVAERLADPDYGVNALRVLVPRDETDPEPPEVAIYNAIDDDWVARKSPVEEVTPDLWVLHVNVLEEIDVVGNPAEGDLADTATVVILLAGVTAEGKSADALIAGHRLMRAVRRCLVSAFRAIQNDELPVLDLEGQSVSLPPRLTLRTQEQKPGSGAVDFALFVPFPIHDTWALSAEEI